MNRLLVATAAIATITLTACETATPYQPLRPGASESGGYSDYRIDASHWRVTFKGNSLTSRETVEKYLLYRTAELTIEQGFDWFDTTDRHTERSTNYYGDTDPFYRSGFGLAYGWGWRPSWRYYGGYGGYGWRGWDPWGGSPFWANQIDIRQVNRYEASTEVVLGKGPAPDGRRVFNAHEVAANLGPAIVKPKS